MKDEIVLYQPNAEVQLEVQIGEDSVWLTQEQIALLFGTQRPAITKHLNNIYKSGELDIQSTCSILERMGNDGRQSYQTKYMKHFYLPYSQLDAFRPQPVGEKYSVLRKMI